MHPVIIEAAINGITTKERNPHVPQLPAEITADALRCLGAGAAIVHNHIDLLTADPPAAAARYVEAWRPVIGARPDALFYPTVGFGGGIEQRFGHIPLLAATGLLRLSLLDPGSVNLGAMDADGLPGGTFDFVYANSFSDIRHAIALCAQCCLGPSIAIYEPGFLRTTLAYARAGRLPAGAFVKFYFGGDHDYLSGAAGGVSFGLPPTPAALDVYLSMLGDCGLPWAVAVLGGDVVGCGMARAALERGGHVRVGLEDYAGPRRPTNAELVGEAATLAAEVGRPVATCRDAAGMLGLSPD
ncbi:MAG: 3-keto-5-aminohexanoate cleavage protein [Candidatus Binatia bacterium]